MATLRFYEREGLIRSVQTQAKHRLFPSETLDQVRRILHYKSLEFPLAEIKQLMDSGPSTQGLSDYQKLQKRLEYILEQKRLWEEQEHRVLFRLSAFPANRDAQLHSL